MSARHRSLVVLRGTREETRLEATRVVSRLVPEQVLWVGQGGASPRGVATLLGASLDAAVIDGHDGVEPDVLGLCHGFVRGGGALVLRLPPRGELPPPSAHLAAFPFAQGDVGRRFHRRFERVLERHPLAPHDPIAAPSHALAGTPEQASVAARLTSLFSAGAPACATLQADRGRGKSAALGLALAAARAAAPRRVALTASHEEALVEVFRFAPGLPFVPLGELLRAPSEAYDVIVVDEAGQVPVPVLRLMTRRFPNARIAFSTTVRGYEGTGRGFALRFVPWLEAEPRPLHRLTLTAPIRWDLDDPLERFVFDALLLDAEPAALAPDAPSPASAEVLELMDREALARNEDDLRALFGLLVHAHYRTTPSDLHRILDAPNLAVHVLRQRGAIVAASVVAHEGGLTEPMCDDLLHGRGRIRAHALADALVSHLGERDAGRLAMVRSVRIAVHPALRRAGLASRLVAHVHDSYAPDLFGTLFGATAELVAFRRALGYEVMRISASRGTRTGEPSVMMLRPVSDAARALCRRLRADLARDLPLQLDLLADDGELVLEPALRDALLAGLPSPAPLDPAACRALALAYAEGPRTLESVIFALRELLASDPTAFATLPRPERAVLEGRVIHGRSWARVAQDAGLPGAGAAMRCARRAMRRVLQR